MSIISPTVTVVIIFLNEERFIKEAIDSVFAQSYTDWELILVDDGSTDASTAMAKKCAENNPLKVRYLQHSEHKTEGMSATRNLGIANAAGEFIAFLDADDVFLPNNLKDQVAILTSEPEVGLVYGKAEYWYSWTGARSDLKRDFTPNLGVGSRLLYKAPTFLTMLLTYRVAIPAICSTLMRREALNRIAGFEDSFKGLHEDQAFLAKLALQENVLAVSSCWARYRQHSESCTAISKARGEVVVSHLRYLNWLDGYLLKQNIKDLKVHRALHSAQWMLQHPVFARLSRSTWRRLRNIRG
jgi:glycosyltransferase involved in cell wall biosynthesis